MEKKKSVYIFSGTHWDREWYQTFQGFRYRLVKMLDDLVDGLEKHPDFNVFHLDGQTIVMEDYAEIEPEKANKLKQYVSENRVKIGPWYVMPDEFNLSGESLIRNLMIGDSLAKQWGAERAWKVGYICDIFGHIAQMPQIFNGFGINYSLFGRGFGNESQPYFIWRAPDGTDCINMRIGNRNGYGEFCSEVVDKKRGMSINTVEEARGHIKPYIDFLLTTSDIPVYIAMDALDHMPVHWDTPEYVKMIEEAYPDIAVHHADLEQACAELEAFRDRMDVVKGEMNRTNKSGGFQYLITHTLSSHYPIKKANDECQNMLEKVTEPMLVLAKLYGQEMNRNYVKLAYKYLVKNHPHDSICGCSIDQVHKDMEYRFDQVKELCDTVCENCLIDNSRPYLEPSEDTDAVLTLYNTLPFDRDEVITADLNMKKNYPFRYAEPFGYEFINSFRITDFDGREVPYQLKLVRRGRTRRIRDQYNEEVDVYRVTFRASVPAGGRAEYRICGSQKPSRYLKHMTSGADYMENDLLRVDIAPNGTISLTDKKTGRIYTDQLGLIDDSEVGDGWNHVTAKEDRAVYSAFGGCHVEKTESGCSRCVFRITKEIALPQALVTDSHTMKRSGEYKTCSAVFEVGLSENARYADVRLVFENNAKDHRLRLLMPTYTDSDKYFAGQAFYCCERSAGINTSTQDWIEPEQYEKAMNGIVGRRGSDGSGLAFVSAAGLHECGSTNDEKSTLFVTLLRSFERTVATNGEIKGQLLGRHEFRFALVPVDDSVSYADLVHIQDSFAAKIISRYTEVKKEEQLTPPVSGFRVSGEGICLTMLKCAEYEDGAYVARMFNASDKPSAAVIETGKTVACAKSVNLNEEATGADNVSTNGGVMTVNISPWHIETVMFRVDE